MERIPPALQELLDYGRAWTPLALAFLAVVARFMMLPHGHSVLTFLRGLAVAGFVAMLTNSALLGYGMNDDLRAALVGGAAFLADDILRGMIALGTKFKDDPQSVIDAILRRK